MPRLMVTWDAVNRDKLSGTQRYEGEVCLMGCSVFACQTDNELEIISLAIVVHENPESGSGRYSGSFPDHDVKLAFQAVVMFKNRFSDIIPSLDHTIYVVII